MSFRRILTKLWSGLKMSGGNNAVQAFWYSLKKQSWDNRFVHRDPPRFSGCGKIVAGKKIDNGLEVEFKNKKVQIEFLAADLVRITWGIPSNFPNYGICKTEWPKVTLEYQEGLLSWKVESSEMRIAVSYDGMIKFFDKAEHLLLCQLSPEFSPLGWRQCAMMQKQEAFYGLGERSCGLNLKGRRYRMWNSDPGGIYWPGDDPLYLCMPVYMGHHEQGNYLLFYENTYNGWIDLGSSDFDNLTEKYTPNYVSAEFDDGQYRYYFIPGPAKRCLERFTELTGRPELPPRWALGYHQSLVAYDNEQDLETLHQNFLQHKLPISAIHLDIEYMDGFRVFTIDSARFPHFKDIAQKLLENGCRLIAIVDAGVKDEFNFWVYQNGLNHEVFCAMPDRTLASGPVWPGWCVFPDFSNPNTRSWWQQHYPFLIQNGVTGFWHDMNEPAIFSIWGDPTLPLATQHSVDNQRGDHRSVHNVYALLENRAGYEALKRICPEQRPFILTRSGWVGIQRYAWKWTGDTACTWENLKATVGAVLGSGLCGIAYNGPDIGGFNGTPSSELYLRWFQLAAFLPFFRGHSAFITPKRRPWDFGEPYLSLTRKSLSWRYRLLPYFYTLAWQANQTGLPLVRPLFWQYSDKEFIGYDESFLLGENLLVAPIYKEALRQIWVKLPEGGWYSLEKEELFAGGKSVQISVELASIPIFVRHGTVLPLEENEILKLHIYPPIVDKATMTTSLYSDAGDNYGPSRVDQFQLNRQNDMLTLTWAESGKFQWGYKNIQVVIHGIESWKQTQCDGQIEQFQKDTLSITKFQKLQWIGCQWKQPI